MNLTSDGETMEKIKINDISGYYLTDGEYNSIVSGTKVTATATLSCRNASTISTTMKLQKKGKRFMEHNRNVGKVC